jgi:hypothetical protein
MAGGGRTLQGPHGRGKRTTSVSSRLRDREGRLLGGELSSVGSEMTCTGGCSNGFMCVGRRRELEWRYEAEELEREQRQRLHKRRNRLGFLHDAKARDKATRLGGARGAVRSCGWRGRFSDRQRQVEGGVVGFALSWVCACSLENFLAGHEPA